MNRSVLLVAIATFISTGAAAGGRVNVDSDGMAPPVSDKPTARQRGRDARGSLVTRQSPDIPIITLPKVLRPTRPPAGSPL